MDTDWEKHLDWQTNRITELEEKVSKHRKSCVTN